MIETGLYFALGYLKSMIEHPESLPFKLSVTDAEKEPRPTGMHGVHFEGMTRDEWLTPPSLLSKLGSFDLDPCSPVNRPWPTAARHFTVVDNGLTRGWTGRVWLNPPYGKETPRWLARMAHHGDGIALIFARTETDAWQRYVWSAADAILFLNQRINFFNVDGTESTFNAGAPSALVAYGPANAEWLLQSGVPGAFVNGFKVLE